MVSSWSNPFRLGKRAARTPTHKTPKPVPAKVDKRKNDRGKKRPGPIATDAPLEEQPATIPNVPPGPILEAIEREAKARGDAPKRWNAFIDPLSDEFVIKYMEFRAALDDPYKTIDGIIREHFTLHERDMLIPVAKRDNPSLYKMQEDNKARYEILFRSHRFVSWTALPDLAFKFTLVHYGLPVPPLKLDNDQSLAAWNEDDEDYDEGEDPVQDDRPPDGHLRFLNSYGVRHFGEDSLRGRSFCSSLLSQKEVG